MAKLERAISSSSFPSNKLTNLTRLYHFLFFALGLSLGLTIGFIDLQTFPLSSVASSISLTSLSPYLSLSSQPPAPSPSVPPPAPPPRSSEAVSASTRTNNNNTCISLKEVGHYYNNNIGHVMQHNMSDKELLWRASMVPQVEEYPYKYVPKVALMFLTKGPLPLSPLWELFLKKQEGFYSIYIHAPPSYNDSWPQTSVFYRRRIPSQEVQWGSISMIDAERRLLANALLDFSNQRFVLLSESCIPLFNFTTIYNYLMNSKVSFLASFDDPRKSGRGRYNPKMSPNITIQDWRKGSQWFAVRRDLAIHMVSDQKYYSIFEEYCHPPCYNDEHYFPTLANILHPNLIANVGITWVDWSHPGPHPGRFIRGDVNEEFINRIRFGSNCTYNGNITSMCFLFARKFVPNTLQPLLGLASKLLGFGL